MKCLRTNDSFVEGDPAALVALYDPRKQPAMGLHGHLVFRGEYIADDPRAGDKDKNLIYENFSFCGENPESCGNYGENPESCGNYGHFFFKYQKIKESASF